MAQLNEQEVVKFWNWFSNNSHYLGDEFRRKGLISELDRRISRLGDFVWEFGPGKVEENAFVISPGGDLELLEISKEVISRATKCKGWEFHYAKPPKDWELKFQFERGDGRMADVDASGWKYVLLEYEDEPYEIIIKLPRLLMELGDRDALIAAEITLDGILGEERRMRLINVIDVVFEFEEKYKDKVSDIKVLSEHLSKLTG